jgi:NADP-dependent 3-hydroxy acid dehydrogenase YdfG
VQKKILITGASKGIGLETARKFLNNGFKVIICASTESSLASVRKQFPRIETYKCNMADKAEVIDFASEVTASFGRLDVLVNNVGRFIPGQIHKEEEGVFEELMHTNLFGTYHLTRLLLPKMIEEKQGTVFNMCSTASITAYTNGGSYCISKYALLGFSKVLREEMKQYNIRVISVLPGATLTASWDGVNLPPERFIPAEDIATAVWEAYGLSPGTVVEEILIRPMQGDIS